MDRQAAALAEAPTRSTGAVTASLVILLISLLGVRIGFAALLEPAWGQDAIWWSFPVSAALALAYYRWGGWRKARMGPPVRESKSRPGAVSTLR